MIKDLYRCLNEHPPELLIALARLWSARTGAGEPEDAIEPLVLRMSDSGTVAEMVGALSPQAQEALRVLQDAGGALPGHRLSLPYGAIRRFGPARLTREQPWLHPENALEELYYRGLVSRAYGEIGDYYGEVFIIPEQIKNALPAPSPVPSPATGDAPEPDRVEATGSQMAEDIFATLARLRQRTIAYAPGTQPDLADLLLGQLGLRARLQGSTEAKRLSLLWRLLWRLGLVRTNHGNLQPSLKAREWLRASDAARAQSLFLTWRDDLTWDDLWLVDSLSLADGSYDHQPPVTRRALLAALADLSVAETSSPWLSLDEFIATLKRRRPDFMRRDGDFERWYARDATSGEMLSGFRSWERIEGALATQIVTQTLHWLGIIELGHHDAATAPSIRLSDLGAMILRGNAPAADTQETPNAAVSEDMRVRILVAHTMYDRYQLERFAEWQSQAEDAVYQITPDSLWRSQSADVQVDQIISFLKRITGGQCPAPALHTLMAWGGKLGRIFVNRVVLLRTVDESTMQQLGSTPTIAPLLGETLSPTMVLVDEADLERLIAELKSSGLWPHITL